MFSKTISNINIKRNRINLIPISEQKSNFQHWPKILSPQKLTLGCAESHAYSSVIRVVSLALIKEGRMN